MIGVPSVSLWRRSTSRLRGEYTTTLDILQYELTAVTPRSYSHSPLSLSRSRKVSEKFPDTVQFHGVNSRIFFDVAEGQGITGYPWVCFYYKGEKVQDMAGLGGSDSIVNWVTKMHDEHFDEDWVSPNQPVAAAKAAFAEDDNEPECAMPSYDTVDTAKLKELVADMEKTLEAVKTLLN